VSSQPSDDKK